MSDYLDKKKVIECVVKSDNIAHIYGMILLGCYDVDPPTPNEIELFPNPPLFEAGYSLKDYHRMVINWHTDAIMYLKRRVEVLEKK